MNLLWLFFFCFSEIIQGGEPFENGIQGGESEGKPMRIFWKRCDDYSKIPLKGLRGWIPPSPSGGGIWFEPGPSSPEVINDLSKRSTKEEDEKVSRGKRAPGYCTEACTPPWIQITFHLDMPKDGGDVGINARAISHGLEGFRANKCDMDKAVMGISGDKFPKNPGEVPGQSGGDRIVVVTASTRPVEESGQKEMVCPGQPQPGTGGAGWKSINELLKQGVGGGPPLAGQLAGPGQPQPAPLPPSDAVYLVRIPQSELGKPVIIPPPQPSPGPPLNPPVLPLGQGGVLPLGQIFNQPPRPPASPQFEGGTYFRPCFRPVSNGKPLPYGLRPIAAIIPNQTQSTLPAEEPTNRLQFEMENLPQNYSNLMNFQLDPRFSYCFLPQDALNTSLPQYFLA